MINLNVLNVRNDNLEDCKQSMVIVSIDRWLMYTYIRETVTSYLSGVVSLGGQVDCNSQARLAGA